ncbi:hypothetical protein ACFWR9_34965 [Streptomyces sp. NPDC058534]|uniref:hypothetical protein n=1 Tax=Streptomyces sp. NPDC058534 TaxID=3346541 RepID=UPI00364F8953
MSDVPRTRARQAELTGLHMRQLDEAQAAVGEALRAVEDCRAAFNDLAAWTALDLGRGGASAVARHFGWSPQYASALVAAYKAKQTTTVEGDVAA